MPRAVFVALVLAAALVIAALAAIEYVASRNQLVDAAPRTTTGAESATPGTAEAVGVDPSASPSFTR